MTWKIIKLSLQGIFHNKMRSFLTMLGIIIGVMAVVILVSITRGAASGITDSISSMGSQQITATISDEEVSVSAEEVESLTSYSTISGAAPVVSTNQVVKKDGTAGNYSVVGITPSYFDVQGIEIQRGREIVESDMEWNTSVCVIGTGAAFDLFGTWDAVDGTIRIGTRMFKVVGVLEEQGSSLAGSDDDRILIPYSTASRMTGQKTLIGRILDGFAGDVWFFSIYLFLSLRLTHETAPWGTPWGIWIWLICAYSGFHCHSKQCALADYYRNIHLYFLKGEAGSELDTYAQQRALMRSLPWNRKEWFHKIYLYFYGNYTRGQERQTPKFQKFYALVRQRYADGIPQPLKERFRAASLPLMKYANILTFDARVIVLFLSLFINMPWLYLAFEVIVLEAVRYYTRHTHETFCERFAKEIENG